MDPKSEEVNNNFSYGITVRTDNLDDNWVKDMIKVYTSDDAREKLNKGYKGASTPLY